MENIKKIKSFELEYTEKDKEYINSLCSYIELHSEEILLFFDFDTFEESVNIKLFDDLETFREACSEIWKDKIIPKWLCGVSFRNNGKDYIYTLSLDEYKKTDGHNNCTLENLKRLIIHEFVHTCHGKYSNIKLPIWLGEGLATFLSHQYDGIELSFDASLEQIINGGTNYINYYTMFYHTLNNYGKNYILKLLRNENFLEKETTKLYDEVKTLYKNKSK